MGRKLWFVAVLLPVGAVSVWAQLKTLKPGFNLFSVQQDIQTGNEAKKQVESQMPVVHDARLTAYLTELGRRLQASPRAGNWPYQFQAINDKNINAFALPGGPIFINTATILAADNEAQLAGVMAHEMSHVVLRHGTHEASKQRFIQIPAILASAAAGNSMLGQLAQLGIGLGANSMLLRYSRDAEAQADYNGAQIMADAGYNPIEMARFFEKLQAGGGSGSEGRLAQFLSDHPTPGNRVKAVEQELQYIPQRQYSDDLTGQLTTAKGIVRKLPAPAIRTSQGLSDGSQWDVAAVRPSGQYREYQGKNFTMSYPDNWEVFGEQQGQTVTFAPRAGLVQSQGGVGIGYGAMMSLYEPDGTSIDLQRDTHDLIQRLQQQNKSMRETKAGTLTRIDGIESILTTLTSKSPFQGQTEKDLLLTAPRPQGLFYIVFIAPESDDGEAQYAFGQMIQSIRFAR